MKIASLFSLFATMAVLILGLTHSEPASACRDCPFPMLISDGRWLMPSGLSVLTVEDVHIGKKQMESTIRLIDSASGEVLAEGFVTYRRGRKQIKAQLIDSSGGSMEIQLFFQDSERKKVQIKVSCTSCSLQKGYWN